MQQVDVIHDINKLPSDGYLVIPLSMSRLANAQDAKYCYDVIKFFEKKITAVGIDIIFLYTNGLYYNSDEPAVSVRKKTNAQMLAHKNAVLNAIVKGKKYIPQAAHFIPWDYVLLNSPYYQDYIQRLAEFRKKDKMFKELLIDGLKGREPTEANINFLIEEIVVTHLIREQLIEFPKTLVKKDSFRLIIYPGDFFKADFYQWSKKVLPQKDSSNPYRAAHYDMSKNILYDFSKMSADFV